MLKFDNQAVGCLDISDVKFAVVVVRRDLLPVGPEVVFPIAVPLRFVFPPMIAMALTFVRPVPYLFRSASRDEFDIAARAFPLSSGRCFYANAVMDTKPHSYDAKAKC